jgi:hypothetical protein
MTDSIRKIKGIYGTRKMGALKTFQEIGRGNALNLQGVAVPVQIVEAASLSGKYSVKEVYADDSLLITSDKDGPKIITRDVWENAEHSQEDL